MGCIFWCRRQQPWLDEVPDWPCPRDQMCLSPGPIIPPMVVYPCRNMRILKFPQWFRFPQLHIWYSCLRHGKKPCSSLYVVSHTYIKIRTFNFKHFLFPKQLSQKIMLFIKSYYLFWCQSILWLWTNLNHLSSKCFMCARERLIKWTLFQIFKTFSPNKILKVFNQIFHLSFLRIALAY